jgi:hypothetical protein
MSKFFSIFLRILHNLTHPIHLVSYPIYDVHIMSNWFSTHPFQPLLTRLFFSKHIMLANFYLCILAFVNFSWLSPSLLLAFLNIFHLLRFTLGIYCLHKTFSHPATQLSYLFHLFLYQICAVLHLKFCNFLLHYILHSMFLFWCASPVLIVLV